MWLPGSASQAPEPACRRLSAAPRALMHCTQASRCCTKRPYALQAPEPVRRRVNAAPRGDQVPPLKICHPCT
eukprot:1141325-Pelagomonas_calceolata.AAC.2